MQRTPKRRWTRGEKLLWLAPLLLVVAAGAALWAPRIARRTAGLPERLQITPDGRIHTLALSRDGSTLAATTVESYAPKTDGGRLYLWDARTLKPRAPWKNTPAFRTANLGLALAPDAKSVGYARVDSMKMGQNKTYVLFDVSTGKARWKIKGRFLLTKVRFSPDGALLGITEGAKTGVQYQIRRVSDGTLVRQWLAPNLTMSDADFAWAPDGKTVVCTARKPDATPEPDALADYKKWLAARQYTIEIRRLSDGKRTRVWNTRPVLSFDLSPDAQTVAAITGERTTTGFDKVRVTVMDSATGREKWNFGDADYLPAAATFAPDGATLAVAPGGFNGLVLLDAQTGKIKRTLRYPGNVRSRILLWSPDSKRLFASGESAVLVWDLD